MRKTTLLALMLSLALAGCTTAAKKPKSDSVPATATETDNGELAIIDAHTHTEFTGQPEPVTGIPVTREEYFRQLKEANAVAAVSHLHRGKDDRDWLGEKNVYHCAGASKNPDHADIERKLKNGRYKCIKIYLGYEHQWANHPSYRRLYAMAAKYDVPVVFHTGDTYSTKGKLKFADPLTIDEVAVDFPKTRFVIAHMGNPWIESAAEVAYKNPNVYLEVSALLIGNMDKLAPSHVENLLVKPIAWAFDYVEDPKKMMFGSDWPLNDIAAYARAVKRAIPREHWKAVFHDNAARVFKIQQ